MPTGSPGPIPRRASRRRPAVFLDFPDDAFFIRHGTALIISNGQEENETIVEIAYPSGRVVGSTGIPAVRRGRARDTSSTNPDDAGTSLPHGEIVVADSDELSRAGDQCDDKIRPQADRHLRGRAYTTRRRKLLGSPNGDTPLADGNLLISEINGNWVDRIHHLPGRLVWACQVAKRRVMSGTHNRLGPTLPRPPAMRTRARSSSSTGLIHLCIGTGQSSGSGVLNRPSLVEQLPSGVLMANDDYNDRMVAIDPATGALVWQYGKTGVAGTGPGIDTPDGFDILAPGGATPTHAVTG